MTYFAIYLDNIYTLNNPNKLFLQHPRNFVLLERS